MKSIPWQSKRSQQFQSCRHSVANSTRMSGFVGLLGIPSGRRYDTELAGHQFKVCTAAVTAIATTCVMVYGGIAVLDGRSSVGTLLVLIAYFASLYSPLENLAYLSEGYASAKAGARRVLEILDEEDKPISDAVNANPLVCDRTCTERKYGMRT